MTVFAEKAAKVHRVEKLLNEVQPFMIGDRRGMLIHKVLEIPELKKSFILER